MARICKIKENDVANGEGLVVSVWFQGCSHHCKGCFNKETWDFNAGKELEFEDVVKIRELINKDGIQRNLSLLGGDPLHEDNFYQAMTMCDYIKRIYPTITIYAWTGYTWEYLIENRELHLLNNVDVLIDGKFEEDKMDLNLKLRGSSNQRIINVKESLKNNKIILQ